MIAASRGRSRFRAMAGGWGNTRRMEKNITKLRKLLKADDSIEIINIHGKGYKLIAPEVEA